MISPWFAVPDVPFRKRVDQPLFYTSRKDSVGQRRTKTPTKGGKILLGLLSDFVNKDARRLMEQWWYSVRLVGGFGIHWICPLCTLKYGWNTWHTVNVQ